ncbi:hypothetical protein PR202_gb06453 [Eleusine coracana subsp. coracana]|uniref:Uncharacterized protein n=1 Tax=Eleusine coracana subsp. coracana TaxID=191504 RepID=A0AAV5E9N1_ELECO|nr:hypothetical protein PR202_gb06453 [Eleusine coracana subsp. coracana]
MLLPQECRNPCRVLGFDVPRGTIVLVNAWAIGRDPEHWDAPEEFVPKRRICPGMAFGLAHIELTLAALLFHFDWRLPEGMVAEEMDMTKAVAISVPPRFDLVLLPVTPMPVSKDWIGKILSYFII